MIIGARVIANFQPVVPEYDSDYLTPQQEELVLNQFLPIINNVGYKFTSYHDVRTPLFNEEALVNYWHSDGENPGTKIMLWSNVNPTRVIDRNNVELYCVDGDIIILEDYIVKHCTPKMDGRLRWFVRAGLYNITD
jgi:hypothetical protein